MLFRAISIKSEHQISQKLNTHKHIHTLKSVATYIILIYDTLSRNIIVRVRMVYIGFSPPINVIES